MPLGDIGHDSPDTSSSGPVKVGGIARDHDGTDPGAVAEGDRVDWRSDVVGRGFVNLGHPRFFQTYTSFSTATTNSALVT